jgi:hypothetical protein
MKKITLLSLAFFTLTVFNSAFAQIKDNAIKLPLVGLFGGQYQLAYERALTDKITVNLSGGYIHRTSSQSWDYDRYTAVTSGFLVVPEARYYFKESMKGMYLGLFGRYKSTTQKLTDKSDDLMYGGTDVSRETKTSSIGGGVVFGIQFLIADAFVIDMFMGPTVKSGSPKTTYNNAGVTDLDFESKFLDFKFADNSNVGLRAGVSVGYAF